MIQPAWSDASRDVPLWLILECRSHIRGCGESPRFEVQLDRMSVRRSASIRRSVRDILDPLSGHLVSVEPSDESLQCVRIANAQTKMADP
jgi:hypothetical protein